MCTLTGVYLFAPTLVAQAAVTHTFLAETSAKLSDGVPAKGPHGEPVPVPGQFGPLSSMSVDSDELYVAEGNTESRIDKFNASSGAFVSQFPQLSSPSFLHQGIVVGRSPGEPQVYVAGDEPSEEGPKGVVAVLNLAGGLLGEVWKGPEPSNPPSGLFGCFECAAPGSIAVDGNPSSLNDWAAGDVYIVDVERKAVDVFKPLPGGGKEFVTRLEGPEPPVASFSKPLEVAVIASSGEVLVADGGPQSGSGTVDVFRPAALERQYEFVGTLTGPPPGGSFGEVKGVSVDGGNGDIYVSEGVAPSVVDELNSEGEYVGRLTGTPAGAFHSVSSVTVDPQSHHVFIADTNVETGAGLIDVYGEDVVIPDVETKPATSVTPEAAQLNGTVNPRGAGPASCQFVWGASEALGNVATCGTVPDGEAPVGVSATLEGLLPDTKYFYRLQASNEHGTNTGEEVPIECEGRPSVDGCFTTTGPGIRQAWASGASSTSVTLNAKVDPHGEQTEVFFEYISEAQFQGGGYAGASSTPSVAIGSSAEANVEAHVQALVPGTVYRYRAVTVSGLGQFRSPDHTFTTQGASGLTLPDGRAWELVSPRDKHGAALMASGEAGLIQASSSGTAISYLATVPTEENPPGYSLLEQVISSRGAGGWSSRDVSLPHGPPTGPAIGQVADYRFFSEDLSQAVVETLGEFTSLAPEVFPPDTERTPYIRRNDECAPASPRCFEPLLTSASGYEDVPKGTEFGGPPGAHNGLANFVGATPDLAHVILSSKVALTTTQASGKTLYEWSVDKPPAERLQLVSALPNGEPVTGETALGFENQVARHAVSDDGSRIVWSEHEGHLYLRHNAAQPQSAITAGKCTEPTKACTLQLDLPEAGCEGQPGECGSGSPSPKFQVASQDVSRVFFTDGQGLTKGSATVSTHPDLYECEIVEEEGVLRCRLSDLTPRSEEDANVLNLVLGASQDGSYVYFAANGVLGDGAEHGAGPGDCPQGLESTETTCNLYMWHDGTISFLATLSGEDFPDWGRFDALSINGQTARVSPSGRYLAFMSDRSLTGYDNHDAGSGKPDEEVFLFDAQQGRLVCASCNPAGSRPKGVEYAHLDNKLVGGDRIWGATTWLAANIPAWTAYTTAKARHQPRYLSDSGRLLFNSSDALVQADVNNNEDVYEYEPASVGGCTAAAQSYDSAAGGCQTLISAGTSVDESAFLDASEGGDDVFFLTAEPLVREDGDTALDVYDAHVCSAAAPCQSATTEPPPCTTADACRAAPTQQPGVFGAPPSATFAGPGTPTPQPIEKRVLTKAQRLAAALKACHKIKKRTKRGACERAARRRYGSRARPESRKSKRGGKR
jgi:hypothetical protein